MERIYIFTRFERFWHWTQALLVIGMMITGFEIHGTYNLLGFAKAHQIHTVAAWALIILWVFAIFWHFITGEWRQYIPTMKGVDKIIRHYAWEYFGAKSILSSSPVPASTTRCRLQAYLAVKLLINPILWISGLLYLYYNELAALGQSLDLATIALIHTIGAFMMLAFFIAHVYLITTGHTVGAHLKAMLTGWEDGEGEHAK
ncbi:MAG: cytochrome b/b6 domain-containing protein [Dechloromonas sp.]|uniref:Cytochrome b/b6 domain-containing protein n=1 Tax=Candidatus Dechloromonas phosphorivorans TaxID=2899244 RepID=A0A935K394_9RHOO|nr:cytochrome b/b6 domain-containing protein [Candidatus Dechloromonas phosphorivorans]